MDDKPKGGVGIPFLALAGVLGIVAGFLLSSALEMGTVKVKESPFGPEPGSRIPRGRDFGGVAELGALHGADQVKYRHAIQLAVAGSSLVALETLESLRKDYSSFLLADGNIALIHIAFMDTSSADSAMAAASLQSALAKDPDHPWINYLAGRFWDKARRPDSALVHYQRAIKAAPQFAYPYIRLGKLQMEKGEMGTARASFRTAIGLMESSPEAYLAGGKKLAVPASEVPPYDYLATLFYETGSEDSALMALEYSQEKGWKTDQMDLVQGWLWEAHGFLHKADSTYRHLIEKDPSNPDYQEALVTLGWKPPSRSGTTRPSDAEAIFAISLLDPLARQHTHNAPLWMALGQAYYRRGMFGLATECFDSSIRYDATLPTLNEKRDAAYQALLRESARPLTAEETRHRPSRFAPPTSEEQTPVVIPGSIALLGTYSVPWGSSQTQVRQTYPKKNFVTLPDGNLMDVFNLEGLTHEYLLAFKNGKLWGVRVYVTDSAGNTGDVFGRVIRTKVKISGEGKGTGEATCTGFRSFQGVIWENDDTFEFMAQFLGKENQVRLVRIGHDYLPQNRRLCDLALYLKEDAWK